MSRRLAVACTFQCMSGSGRCRMNADDLVDELVKAARTPGRRVNRPKHLTLTPAANAALEGVAPGRVSRYISQLIELDSQGRAPELPDYSTAELLTELQRRQR